jgi:hypothetical protein
MPEVKSAVSAIQANTARRSPACVSIAKLAAASAASNATNTGWPPRSRAVMPSASHPQSAGAKMRSTAGTASTAAISAGEYPRACSHSEKYATNAPRCAKYAK